MNVYKSISSIERRRNLWRNLCGAGAVLSAAMLGVSVASVIGAGALPAGTPPTAGFAVSPTSGDSSTEIELTVSSPNNVCPGDSATGNFRWQTFIVPASVDAATLTYNSSGPIAPAGVGFAWPMYAFTGQDPVVNGNTAVSTGQVTNVPSLGLGVFGPGDVAPGQYKVGLACSKPPAPGQPAITERYWQQTITVVANAAGGPAQFTWSVAQPTTSTTTTTTVAAVATTTTVAAGAMTTTIAGATTSTVAGATTTTVAGATTTTVAGATTTTIAASAGPTTTFAGSFAPGGGTSGSGGAFGTGSGGTLPVSGANGLPIVVWGVLLVVFGRMVVLLARPVRVIPSGPA